MLGQNSSFFGCRSLNCAGRRGIICTTTRMKSIWIYRLNQVDNWFNCFTRTTPKASRNLGHVFNSCHFRSELLPLTLTWFKSCLKTDKSAPRSSFRVPLPIAAGIIIHNAVAVLIQRILIIIHFINIILPKTEENMWQNNNYSKRKF